ncbi:MAG: helix-turn-helix domain-containing protein [Lutibacter sp.]|uniref:helix-turn-helix domain-containing protein n=1 Tax=Lutibacter sp. TaxID=1925666 RepID=UPI0019E4FEE1|nr:helix-turn-helix domain-containing protein [Lutibacter sp.]NOR28607.1 helix-turn-helix domain-containing protein [Lutibacter sp.]
MKKNKNPNFNFFIALTCLLLNIQWAYSQQSTINYTPDSLKNKTYKELYNGFNLNYNDTLKEKIYVTTYLVKAKKEKDTINIAKGYSFLTAITKSSIAIKYCDSIINLTKNKSHIKFPAYGYMVKGILNFNLGREKIALENYLIALELANKKNNLEQIFYINNLIGQLKNLWGNFHEGLKIFKSQLKIYTKKKKKFENNQIMFFNTLFQLSNSYILTKKLDSSFLYSKIGLQESLKLNNTDYYYLFVAQIGEIAYHKKNYKMALDSLKKAFPFESTNNGLLNNYYYRGLIYQKQQKDTEAFYHFKKADSIYNITNDVVPEVRDIQEYFVNYYKKNKDITNQLLYIDRLLYVDSIIKNNYKNLNETLVKKYDTPLLLSEKEKIITHLKIEEKKSRKLIYILIIGGFFSCSIFIWYYLKQRILKDRFKKLISNRKKEITIKNSNNKGKNISKTITKVILISLNEFETKNLYLENNLTLNELSKKLHTNSNYLSKVINSSKGKNFSTYISDLRIDFCIEKLKTDITFRKYTISAIAYEMGFNNVESFSKSFHKKTAIYPSYFIKEISKEQ